jgi:hypothetical protein
MGKIIENKIKCKHCGDIIESTHVHDYKRCKCGKVAVDGGHYYLRRSFPEMPAEEHYEELSICEEI